MQQNRNHAYLKKKRNSIIKHTLTVIHTTSTIQRHTHKHESR